MNVWEREEVQRTMFWAAAGCLADISGTLLGILAVLKKGKPAKLKKIVDVVSSIGLSEYVLACVLMALICEGLVKFDDEKKLVIPNQAVLDAAKAAWESIQRRQCIGPVELLRLLANVGERALRAC